MWRIIELAHLTVSRKKFRSSKEKSIVFPVSLFPILCLKLLILLQLDYDCYDTPILYALYNYMISFFFLFLFFSAWVQVSEGSETVTVVFKPTKGDLVHGGTAIAKSGCWTLLKGGMVANFSSSVEIFFEVKFISALTPSFELSKVLRYLFSFSLN